MERVNKFVEEWYCYLFQQAEDDYGELWSNKPSDELDAYITHEFLINSLDSWDGCDFAHYAGGNDLDNIMNLKTCCEIMNFTNTFFEDNDDALGISGEYLTPKLVISMYAYAYMKSKSLEELKYILGLEEQGYVLK